jgi:hypothetical protein
MKIETIYTLVTETKEKDCELISFDCGQKKNDRITYRRNKNKTYWNINIHGLIDFKLVSIEIVDEEYLNLPKEGIIFALLDSPWIAEMEKEWSKILDEQQHFILRFKNCIIEVIAQQLEFESVKDGITH